ncbi:MAG: DNA helicase RecG, partial [Actinobacteria bacterium]
MPLTLRRLRDLPIKSKQADRLAEMGITSVLDLLQHYPHRYHDRTKRAEIAELAVGQEATVFGDVRKVSARRTRNRRSLVEVVVSDGEKYLSLTFFNQPWRAKQLVPGMEVSLFGRLEVFRGQRKMTNPVLDVVGGSGEDKTGVIVPIYPQSGKADVTTWQLKKLVATALDWVAGEGGLADPLDADVRERLKVADRDRAYRGVHRPETEDDWVQARRRLVFDEFFRMQLGLVARKRAFERERAGIRHHVEGELVTRFHAQLPFNLTGAQHAAIEEIARDMAGPSPMHRLLQGDVGSGKTVVALTALLVAAQGGYQGALMAPTEVLAEQHHLSLRALL